MAASIPLTTPFANAQQVAYSSIESARKSRCSNILKLSETILLTPFTATATLALRSVKFLSWDMVKSGIYKFGGYHTESAEFMHDQYFKTVKAVRDVLYIPYTARQLYKDLNAEKKIIVDDFTQKLNRDFFKIPHSAGFEDFSSSLHGEKKFAVIKPEKIVEFPAANDPNLKAVMASHIFKPGVMAINFGTPNLSTFITKENNGEVETVKIDAKSLCREPMSYHETHGKIQSGLFFIPSNLPKEALERFEKAAQEMAGQKHATCVNTNCRVLQNAGFGIEGVNMEDVIFPNIFMEYLLFRNVYYTDDKGIKHKVHFKILNTTNQSLEQYYENLDTAVVSSRFRHKIRHADTEENQKARSQAAKALIQQEKDRLQQEGNYDEVNDEYLGRWKVSISVPSLPGRLFSWIWGRHTMYELDLSDKQNEIQNEYIELAQNEKYESVKLRPFPQQKPNFATRVKRDIFFSGRMIRFLRRHMMGREEVIYLYAQDIFKHLKSNVGEHFNYVLLDDKLIIAKVNANGSVTQKHRKFADWALSKHALLAGRKDIYCSGEMWVQKNPITNIDEIIVDPNSGSYVPKEERVSALVKLANKFFDTNNFKFLFKVAGKSDN